MLSWQGCAAQTRQSRPGKCSAELFSRLRKACRTAGMMAAQLRSTSAHTRRVDGAFGQSVGQRARGRKAGWRWQCWIARWRSAGWLDACYGRRASVRGEGGGGGGGSGRADVSRWVALPRVVWLPGLMRVQVASTRGDTSNSVESRAHAWDTSKARQGKPICSSAVLRCLTVNLKALV